MLVDVAWCYCSDACRVEVWFVEFARSLWVLVCAEDLVLVGGGVLYVNRVCIAL